MEKLKITHVIGIDVKTIMKAISGSAIFAYSTMTLVNLYKIIERHKFRQSNGENELIPMDIAYFFGFLYMLANAIFSAVLCKGIMKVFIKIFNYS